MVFMRITITLNERKQNRELVKKLNLLLLLSDMRLVYNSCISEI